MNKRLIAMLLAAVLLMVCAVPAMAAAPKVKKIEHVVMRVAPDRYPYIKNKPLHPSQRCSDKEMRITIDVIPNSELISLLLSFGSQLEVLEPQSVRDMMREHVKTLNKFYK